MLVVEEYYEGYGDWYSFDTDNRLRIVRDARGRDCSSGGLGRAVVAHFVANQLQGGAAPPFLADGQESHGLQRDRRVDDGIAAHRVPGAVAEQAKPRAETRRHSRPVPARRLRTVTAVACEGSTSMVLLRIALPAVSLPRCLEAANDVDAKSSPPQDHCGSKEHKQHRH